MLSQSKVIISSANKTNPADASNYAYCTTADYTKAANILSGIVTDTKEATCNPADPSKASSWAPSSDACSSADPNTGTASNDVYA